MEEKMKYRNKTASELIEISKTADDAYIFLQYDKIDTFKLLICALFSIPFLIYGD